MRLDLPTMLRTDKDGERRIARSDYLAWSGRKDGFLRTKLADKDGNPLRGSERQGRARSESPSSRIDVLHLIFNLAIS
jgi:hypothetical protein